MILLWLGCVEYFDVSSSVVVLNENMVAINSAGYQFCQALTTGEKNEAGENVVHTACSVEPVVNGVVDLPNWEGYYRNGMQGIALWVESSDTEERIDATLLDSDEDVWCDNVDVDVDSDGSTTSTQFCSNNYEFYLLWQVIMPVDDG